MFLRVRYRLNGLLKLWMSTLIITWACMSKKQKKYHGCRVKRILLRSCSNPRYSWSLMFNLTIKLLILAAMTWFLINLFSCLIKCRLLGEKIRSKNHGKKTWINCTWIRKLNCFDMMITWKLLQKSVALASIELWPWIRNIKMISLYLHAPLNLIYKGETYLGFVRFLK